MKKLVAFVVLGAALAVSACAANGSADYGYETQAPYASDRTVGDHGAEPVFQARQAK